MSKPKWHDAWQEAFEDGFDEDAERLTHPAEKKAVAIRRNEDGSTEVVRTASGAEAIKMIAEAEAQGLAIEQNSTQVEELMAEQNGATDVPPEIYALMSSVIDFARELTEEWKCRHDEDLLGQPKLVSATEIEYTMDDVED
jgi:type III secretion system FlhB-like substrate exporter